MYTASKQSNIYTNSNLHQHQPTNSSIGISSTNYRKFQHRRIHTQIEEPNSSSASNAYQYQYQNRYNMYNNSNTGAYHYLSSANNNNINSTNGNNNNSNPNSNLTKKQSSRNKLAETDKFTSTQYTAAYNRNQMGSNINQSANSSKLSYNNNAANNKNITDHNVNISININTSANTNTTNNKQVTNNSSNQTKPVYKFSQKLNNAAGQTKYFKTEGDLIEDTTDDKDKYYLQKKSKRPDNTNNNTNNSISNTNTTLYHNNKYEIQGIAGKGTFGVVYFGKVCATGEKIALKKVLQDKKYKNRELQILKQVKHSNILQMKDYFITSQGLQQYLNVIMDYYSDNLYQVIKKKQLSPLLIKLYTYQILRGLNYLSSLSISHRDIKPQNILVDKNTNKVVICDFGSAKRLIKGEPNIAYICSRCYRAPELIFGATQYTSQIDMWSAGCVIVQMINGEAPFLGDSQIDQLLEIIKVLGTPQKGEIEEMNPKYDLKEYKKFPNIKSVPWRKILKTEDPLLVDLITKILQYSPKKRFTAAEALKHPYFDQLSQLQNNKDDDYFKKMKIKCIPQLFNYTQDQLASLGIKQSPKKKQSFKQKQKQDPISVNKKSKQQQQDYKEKQRQRQQQVKQKLDKIQIGSHISHIRHNSDFRPHQNQNRQYSKEYALQGMAKQDPKSFVKSQKSNPNYPTLGSGHKLIQRRVAPITASSIYGTSGYTNSGQTAISSNVPNQGVGPAIAISSSSNTSGYGKNTSTKRFQYR